MKYSINQLRDYAALFSRSEVSRWLNNDYRSIEQKIYRYNDLLKFKGISYLNILKQTYKIIVEKYPNEYILKNEFINQWLKKELGNDNSIIINELRIGKAIVDIAMFNGKSIAFEIKTILDSEHRLLRQLHEYKKIFNEIYIIIPIELLSKYLNFDDTIGVITYNSRQRIFNLFRKSKYHNSIDVNILMDILHTKEYNKIVKNNFNEIPEMNSFNQFDICKKLISKIPESTLNELFINAMKERKINNVFFNKIHREFNQICLSFNLNEKDRNNMISNLKTNTVE